LSFNSALVIERHPMGRARITNRVLECPPGIDGRSERGRRWKDLLNALIVSYGQDEPDRLRELATLKLSYEATQAAVVTGDVLRSEDVVRLGNLVSRRERELALRARGRLAQASTSAAPTTSAPDLSSLSDAQLDRLGALLLAEQGAASGSGSYDPCAAAAEGGHAAVTARHAASGTDEEAGDA
jgi:hypothetical protein